MSPISRPAASAQSAQQVPKPAVDTTAPAHVPPPAANASNSDTSWVKRHKGLSIILAIAIVGGGISIISNLSNSDSPQASATTDSVPDGVTDKIPISDLIAGMNDTPMCSPESLKNLVSEYIDLGNSTQSAYMAIPDVLTPAVGSKRLKIRFARESAQQKKIKNECAAVSDSNTGEELVASVKNLQIANSALYDYYEGFLDTKTGTSKGFEKRSDRATTAIDRFNAAWEAFGEEQDFKVDQTPDPPVDESKAAD